MTGKEACEKIMEQVNHVISGKEDTVKKVMIAILAKGHILIEDIPGVGKTTMAKAFALAMSLDSKRMQFTTDVMPSDITGYRIFDKRTNEFVYKPGVIMCNLFLADEINRTSSKTQGALLEVMEERKVTVDGETRKVPSPFIVIATQNPVGSIGTMMLPESQLDRFMFKLSMGYPSVEDEILMIKAREETDLLTQVKPIVHTEGLEYMQKETEEMFIHDHIIEYIVELVNKTRNHPYISYGISPRGTLAMVAAAKANAYIDGRDYVIPDDVKAIFYDICVHRLILSAKAKLDGVTLEYLIQDFMRETPVKR